MRQPTDPKMYTELQPYQKLTRIVTPVAGQLELTSKCFQRCYMCDSWREDVRDHHALPFQFATRFVDELNKYSTFENLSITGGDPQAYPHFEQFLHHCHFPRKWKLQVNTALTQDKRTHLFDPLYVDELRVSFDHCTLDGYASIRGDKNTHPTDVLGRIDHALGNEVGVTTLTCVVPKNIDSLADIVKSLESLDYRRRLRKAIFLPVIGDRGTTDASFIKKWRQFCIDMRFRQGPFPTSCGSDPTAMRDAMLAGEYDDVPCVAENNYFHIKSNGDYYPCCLVGGEALPTKKDFCLGNITQTPLKKILKEIRELGHLRDKRYCTPTCRSVCQLKQLTMNELHLNSYEQTSRMP